MPGPGQSGGTPPTVNSTRTPPNGTPSAYSGVEVAVAIGSTAKLYKDVTQMSPQSGGMATAIQQQLQAVDTLDNLIATDANGGTVTAWGTKNGEKIDATLVVYRSFGARPGNAVP